MNTVALKLIRAHFEKMGSLWHQSIKVSAKIMPCHSWRALKLMSVSSFDDRWRANVHQPHPYSPTPLG